MSTLINIVKRKRTIAENTQTLNWCLWLEIIVKGLRVESKREDV